MPVRRLPVRPDLDQLKRQAKELLRGLHSGDASAVAELREWHPDPVDPALAKLSDAQLVLARSYQASSWPRLVQSVELADAIWRDDVDAVRGLVASNPSLIHEHVLIRTDSHWGPPMTYAANLGRDAIIRVLRDRGATDLESAGARAALQGQVETAKMIYDLAGRPPLYDGALSGPAYTLNLDGSALLLTLGAPLHAGTGCPAETVLQTDGRNPAAKHAILELYAKHGLALPDTPAMALHRGRIDLLEEHLRRDPSLLTRTFSHREIYPAELGCGDPIEAVTGTPLDGTTLLHMCVEYDELEIGRWLLDRGMSPNVRAAVGRSGFGGYTPLFNAVVSLPNFWMNYGKRGPFAAPFAALLLERGANPNVRASLWKRLGAGHDDSRTRHEYRDVTPLSWGHRFHQPIFVSEPALRLIEAAGGVE
ncbi:MAG TPA: ankyrin repeat domain-containing protein [Gemmatimonadaceae bacterium]|nr:ankyrin repeat domain-containing protein [Gemmatimonadaceae bacterium]